jgi:hypothetical protein
MQSKAIAFKCSVVTSDNITTNEIDLTGHKLLGHYQELPKLGTEPPDGVAKDTAYYLI